MLTWDDIGSRTYETGVDHGVLYIPDEVGVYTDGVAWNGLVTVTESPSGAEANPQYADNIKYLNLFSAEDFTATLEALTYPDEFNQFDGLGTPTPGMVIGQQSRKTFGLSYRTLLGNDLEGNDYGEKIHLVYGCSASPSEKAYGTVNDSPEPITFSWELTTTPVPVVIAGQSFKPTALVVVEKNLVSPTGYTNLLNLLYGAAGNPVLPSPGDVYTTLTGSLTEVTSLTAPNFSGDPDLVITEGTGVRWYADGALIALDGGGSTTITLDGPTIITAHPAPGYVFAAGIDNTWAFTPA